MLPEAYHLVLRCSVPENRRHVNCPSMMARLRYQTPAERRLGLGSFPQTPPGATEPQFEPTGHPSAPHPFALLVHHLVPSLHLIARPPLPLTSPRLILLSTSKWLSQASPLTALACEPLVTSATSYFFLRTCRCRCRCKSRCISSTHPEILLNKSQLNASSHRSLCSH